MDLFESEKKKPKILLLDYQATLVSNFDERKQWMAVHGRGNYIEWIKQERFREWIPQLAEKEGLRVILITARDIKYRDITLQMIRDKIGWVPTEFYFNEWKERPEVAKKKILEQYIYPKFGTNKQDYIAFESNERTREMYKKERIFAMRVKDPIPNIPLV